MIQRIAAFRAGGEGFDGVALDLEDTQGFPMSPSATTASSTSPSAPASCSGRAVPLGAIVYPAVQTELINPVLWPTFPYRRLQPSVDVWMPMAYFTFRDVESGYRDPLEYTEDSVALLRAHLRDNRRPCMSSAASRISRPPRTTPRSSRPRARREAVGYSMYDFRTTSSAAWAALRDGCTTLSRT